MFGCGSAVYYKGNLKKPEIWQCQNKQHPAITSPCTLPKAAEPQWAEPPTMSGRKRKFILFGKYDGTCKT